MPRELYKIHRPKTLKEMVGQPEAVATVGGWVRSRSIPHAILLTGPSGVGKTTVARILKRELACNGSDFQEINAASSRGIDDVRKIDRDMHMAPMMGKCRIYYLDECFPAGTIISTPNGPRNIESMREGEDIFHVGGVGVVSNRFAKEVPLTRLVRVRFDDGTSIITTEEHRFLTEHGWVEASRLYGATLFRYNHMNKGGSYEENLRMVRGRVPAHQRHEAEMLLQELWKPVATPIARLGDDGNENLSNLPRFFSGASKERWPKVLFGGMQAQRIVEGVLPTRFVGDYSLQTLRLSVSEEAACGKELLLQELQITMAAGTTVVPQVALPPLGRQKDQQGKTVVRPQQGRQRTISAKLRTNEKEQSFAEAGGRREDEGYQTAKRDSQRVDRKAGRKRTANQTAEAAMESVGESRPGMENGDGNLQRGQTSGGFSDQLQSGHWSSAFESGNRSRWEWPRIEKGYVARCQEDPQAQRVRVVSVEVYEPGRNDAVFMGVVSDQDRVRGAVSLYDLSVSGHPSYFANGLPVHNCHQISQRRGGDGQTAMLKMLEDTPSHVYFILSTTDPRELLTAIRTRCSTVTLRPVPDKDMRELLSRVSRLERIDLSDGVRDRIVEASEGSARSALVLLHKVRNIDGEQGQLDAVLRSDAKKQAIDLARAIIWPGSKWAEVSKIIQAIDEEPETIRRVLRAYAEKVVLGGGKLASRAGEVLDILDRPIFGSDRTALTNCAWQMFNNKG